ncbi:hypothetical protein FF38_04342 [Lucilia cuprina]|uniref:Uncharacterized protein n=1 Tax=Lucilia cuprina TaxID=7375 RepID=A0A0L0CPH5_LUCCU|nr:hypothetical protein FF38_04342 [Lucilia cuprina]
MVVLITEFTSSLPNLQGRVMTDIKIGLTPWPIHQQYDCYSYPPGVITYIRGCYIGNNISTNILDPYFEEKLAIAKKVFDHFTVRQVLNSCARDYISFTIEPNIDMLCWLYSMCVTSFVPYVVMHSALHLAKLLSRLTYEVIASVAIDCVSHKVTLDKDEYSGLNQNFFVTTKQQQSLAHNHIIKGNFLKVVILNTMVSDIINSS